MSQTAHQDANPSPKGLAGSTARGSEDALIESVTEPDPGTPGPIPASDSETADTPPDTHQRILDVALDLFIAQGFDGTSLRQIADELGVTKAALYYHFESKEDILMALHMRLHEFGREALLRMGDGPITLEQWGELLDQIVDQMLTQRKIFLMHERNQTALEKLHRKDHDAEHEDIQNRFRLLLADTRLSLRDRVRMAASFGVVFSSLFISGNAFESSTNEELGSILRDVIRSVLEG